MTASRELLLPSSLSTGRTRPLTRLSERRAAALDRGQSVVACQSSRAVFTPVVAHPAIGLAAHGGWSTRLPFVEVSSA
jgi:hypothetical protein